MQTTRQCKVQDSCNRFILSTALLITESRLTCCLIIVTMATSDVKLQNVLYSWMIPVILALLAYVLLKKYGSTLKDR